MAPDKKKAAVPVGAAAEFGSKEGAGESRESARRQGCF
jgi:hypothetical protein